MLRKITFFFGAAVMSSSLFAMHNGNNSLVLFNQTGVVVASNYTMQSGTNLVSYSTSNPRQQTNSKKSFDQSFSTKVLQEAAMRDIRIRDLKAQKISEELDKNYVGAGDQWALKKQLYLNMNIHTVGWESSENIVAELNQLCSHCPLDRPLINKVREINRRFNSLLGTLVRKKRSNYRMFVCFDGLCRSPQDENSCLRHWEIDSFFDAQVPYNQLSPSLQQYVQAEVENKYKEVFRLSDDRNDIKAHALKKSARYSTYDAIAYLKALLETKTLKNLPSDRKSEVKKEICAKIESLCAKPEITNKEGKFCDGGELKQECQ